jgi:ketosteroid isomerase-like protein
MSELALLAQQRNEAIAAANRRLDRRFSEALGNNDVEGAIACFLDSPDLIVLFNGVPLRGPAAVRHFLTEIFSRTRTVRLELDDLSYSPLGETVFAAGTATCRCEGLDHAISASRQYWTDARQNVAGRWVYVLSHATRLSRSRSISARLRARPQR